MLANKSSLARDDAQLARKAPDASRLQASPQPLRRPFPPLAAADSPVPATHNARCSDERRRTMPSNNPFAPAPPSEVSQAAHRFPDVLNQDPDLRHHQQLPPQPQPQMQPGLFPAQPQQQGYGFAPQQTGYAPYPAPGQPTTGGGYYSNQQPQPQQTGYANPSPYTSSSNATGAYGQTQPYFSDLDPYSSLGASSFASSSSQQQSNHNPQQQGSGTLLAVPQTVSHPRDYVHENKAALMVWDEYAWKQLFSRSVSCQLGSRRLVGSGSGGGEAPCYQHVVFSAKWQLTSTLINSPQA